MTIHALTGLPRSGTTLLANVLSQHPDVYVSGTSALYNCVEAVSNAISTAPEVQADLVNVPGSYDRYLAAFRGLMDGWYVDSQEDHIVDKSRGWLMQPMLLKQIDPSSHLIVCVRDPRDVVASVERQHLKTAAFASPLARTLAESTQILMKPDGMVGGAIRFIEDIVRRMLPVTIVRYESFVVSPEPVLAKIQSDLGLEAFSHDLMNVENVATDLDALTRGKYPHDGSGPVKPSGHQWSDVLPADISHKIAISYPMYMQTFGYG